MPAAVHHETLKFQNVEFAIHHLIEDCPAHTVVRELIKNAQENATLLNPPGKMECFQEKVNGVRKLGFFNEGPGMSDGDLRRLMDMASTGKTLGTSDNFGQGGKVSGLKVSPRGLVYRSCKNGQVCEIVLAAETRTGMSYPTYVKKRVLVSDEAGQSYEVVIDVTDRYRDRADRPLDRDWTEVLLIGHTDDQDTVATLIPDTTRKNWLISHINKRFYKFPPGFVVRNADASSGQSNRRTAHGLEHLALNWSTGEGDGQHEDAQAVHPVYGPVTIRYFKLKGTYGVDDPRGNSRAKTMEANGIGSRGDHICIVWRDECYEVRTGWSQISGAFGVTFGSANVAIHIVLADDAPVKNNTYRDKVIRQEDSGHYLALEEFADLVCQHRPQWLIDYVEAEANRSNTGGNVSERLRQFLQELMVTGEERPVVEPGGEDQGEIRRGRGRNGKGGGGGADGDGSSNRPAQGRRTTQNITGIPNVDFTNDPAILEEMRGRAAVYRRSANLVLLNPEHFLYQRDLQRLYEDVGPDSERQQLARQFYNEEYRYQAGKYVVQAWIFRGRSEWNDDEFEAALSMGAMTVNLASPNTLDTARRRYRQRVNASRVEAAGAN
jgi:hypothetical protein